MSVRERKLTCSTPNANRARGGVAYYCVPSSKQNFLCHKVDQQIEDWLLHIQIDPAHIPAIRQTCKQDVQALATFDHVDERKSIQKELDRLHRYERQLYTDKLKGTISEELYQELWHDFKEQRDKLTTTLEAAKQEQGVQLEGLDDALYLISQIGVLYKRLDKFQQRALLKHLIKRVVINTEGTIVRIDLHPPFGYLLRKSPQGGGFASDWLIGEQKTDLTGSAGSSLAHESAPNRVRGHTTQQDQKSGMDCIISGFWQD